MALTRRLGFARLDCGCLTSRYHESAIKRDVSYVEEKGFGCRCADHQRHQFVSSSRRRLGRPLTAATAS